MRVVFCVKDVIVVIISYNAHTYKRGPNGYIIVIFSKLQLRSFFYLVHSRLYRSEDNGLMDVDSSAIDGVAFVRDHFWFRCVNLIAEMSSSDAAKVNIWHTTV